LAKPTLLGSATKSAASSELITWFQERNLVRVFFSRGGLLAQVARMHNVDAALPVMEQALVCGH